ncbi:hypothetical protein SORBI_3004G254100 [Sorghum bicolor]|uniref:ABC transporter domain-containing protein n=1 Tax=Sorghum bicolor TaxID=4558 RepID=A0A1Z5RPL9_SORBI|nr:hypothetical protein SORBI_3004G254100 [Sorghum bicolor]
MRKGILAGDDGHVRQVDVRRIGRQEVKNLVDRLVSTADEDNSRLLLRIRERMQRVGMDNPTIEVRFERLGIEAEAPVGNKSVPTFLSFFSNSIMAVLNAMHIIPTKTRPISILRDLSGIIRPSRMTLLLGSPGSGKTSLLLALAGRLESTLKVSGTVIYNGHGMNEFVPQKTSAYIGQDDVHIGEMTVREILAFSARCQGVGTRYDMIAELSRREKEANLRPDPDLDVYMKAISVEGQERVITDYTLKILGLETCADTMVGDTMIRGISGGQKKRLTIGEMLVGPAKAFFMDEISNGLDTSTAYQIINTIRNSIKILGGTALIALLQPPPETYELFDDIVLLSEGQIVYQGPRENILEFFEALGFKCPERKGVADFLQEVTSRKDQHQYWCQGDKPHQYISVNNFVEAFKAFHVGHKLVEELSVPFDRSRSHPAALATSEYGIRKMELLKACFSREWLLMKRNLLVYILRVVKVIVIGTISMTVFLRTEMHRSTVEDGVIFLGAIFLSIVTHLFNGFTELSMSISRLPVFYKQRDMLLYPAWAYALPTWLVKIPTSFIECAVWIGMTYYAIGFDPNVERFFRHYLLLVLISQMASGLFRLTAALGREMIVANTFGAFAQIFMLILGGFLIDRDNIKNWWIWGYWSSPLMYAQNAMAMNEFLGHSWQKVVNITASNNTLGIQVLEARGIFVDLNWYWIGVCALLGYIILFNILFVIFLDWLDPLEKGHAVVSEEEQEKHADNHGKGIRSLSAGKELQISPINGRREMTAPGNEKRGMVLPFIPLSITFLNVRYSVDIPQEMKEKGRIGGQIVLLKGVSGAFRPGVLTALMGVSGAGKTTLLDVLAGRKTSGYIEGEICISGYPKKQETFARISGYCEQNDIHSPHVTVHESLMYSAWLRLPLEFDPETRKMFVDEIIELVELTPLRGALVGLPGVNGLSTEQRKRLTIAVELVANPSIVFMDEPTSGLDARNMVDTGRTVVCTIHQPSIDIFESFDELILLKQGGEEIYVGPLGRHSCHLISYFEGIQGVNKIKDGYNPATWMLEVTTPAQEDNLGISFAELYKNSDLYWRNKALVSELSKPPPGSKDLYFPTQYSQSFHAQCMACLWKQNKSYWRNPSYTAMRIFFTTVVALIFSTIFLNFGKKVNKRQDLFNSFGSMYAAVIFIGMQNGQTVQPIVETERMVFYREKAAGMYSALPYAFAQVLIEIPHIFLQTIVYGLIVYILIGFDREVDKFFWYIFFMFFTFMYFTFCGMMAVAMTPSTETAAILSTASYAIWNIFAGFLVPWPRMPIWWRWYAWACPVAWTLYGLAASQYGESREMLKEGEMVKDYVDRLFGYRHDHLPYAAGAVVGFTILFASSFAFSIKVFNFQRR